ncbi:unnamed protein product [Diamesa tonsa]
MEPIKRDGKYREQLKREETSRREYAKKWSFMSKPELNQFYSQSFLNDQVAQKIPKDKFKDASHDYTGHGDSYFVSKGMHEAKNLCRCGRKLEGTHLVKCMQKCLVKYSIDESNDIPISSLPLTSNAIHGWPECKYKMWEKSTYYISPKTTMKGPKVTENPYNNIILG